MRIGVIGTSAKENERRVPLHPDHLPLIPEAVRRQLFFEPGYATPFGGSDAQVAALTGGLAPRAELLAEMDAVILLKPVEADLRALREGGVLWGWPHAVQQRAITEAAIDRRLTLIAFEHMFAWRPEGERGLHTFHRNNVLAGYAAVLHALSLRGIAGPFGRPRRAVVLGAGQVGRGALQALQALGFREVTVCSLGPAPAEVDLAPGCRYLPMRREAVDPGRMAISAADGGETPLLALLAAADIVVNAIQQDPLRPVMFVDEAEVGRLAPGCLIIDVSCDAGMGFAFARPTSFQAPLIRVGACAYYAVDHTPSYLWESASWEISHALLPHLEAFAAGPEAWAAAETLRRAIDIEAGAVRNPAILAFQARTPPGRV